MADRTEGTVRWFNNEKGYGFIALENGENVFVHYSEVDGPGYPTLERGERVSFEIIQGRNGLRAQRVVRSSRNSVSF